jgi:hypothetical protein
MADSPLYAKFTLAHISYPAEPTDIHYHYMVNQYFSSEHELHQYVVDRQVWAMFMVTALHFLAQAHGWTDEQRLALPAQYENHVHVACHLYYGHQHLLGHYANSMRTSWGVMPPYSQGDYANVPLPPSPPESTGDYPDEDQSTASKSDATMHTASTLKHTPDIQEEEEEDSDGRSDYSACSQCLKLTF